MHIPENEANSEPDIIYVNVPLLAARMSSDIRSHLVAVVVTIDPNSRS